MPFKEALTKLFENNKLKDSNFFQSEKSIFFRLLNIFSLKNVADFCLHQLLVLQLKIRYYHLVIHTAYVTFNY